MSTQNLAATSTLDSVAVLSTSKAESTQASTSQPPQASSTSSSSTSASTTALPVSSAASTNSPVASLTVPSSTPSQTLHPSSAPNVSATSSIINAGPSAALMPSQSSSSSPSQNSTAGVSFFHNKPLMIAVFASAGVFVLVVLVILGTIAVRRKRRKDLLEGALNFPLPTDNLINDHDNYSRGGSVTLGSRNSGNSTSDAQSIALGANPYMPSLAPAPIPVSVPTSIYAPREMQQRGPGIGYFGDRGLDRGEMSSARYAYGRQQRTPSPQYQQQRQQQLRYQPQQQTRPPPQLDYRPRNVSPIPPSLVPSSLSRRESAVFDVPFAPLATQPSRLSLHDGRGEGLDGTRMWESRTGTRERAQKLQVPLPPPGKFPRMPPDTVEHDDGSWENVGVVVDEERVLQVVNA